MGKLLKLEGAYIWVSSLFYRAVIQVVLMVCVGFMVMPDIMMKSVEGKYVGLIYKITGKWERSQEYGAWETPAVEELIRSVGTHSEAKYLSRQHVTVAQRAALHPIIEVCARETIFGGGGVSKW